MYPSKKHPNYGVFVKRTYSQLKLSNHEVSKVVIDKTSKNKIFKLYLYIQFYFDVIVSTITYKPDVIYVNYVSHSAPPVILMKLLRFKFDIFSHVHGGDIKLLTGRNKIFHFAKYRLSKYILNISKKVICPSESYKNYIEENFPKHNNIIVYPSGGVDNEVFKFKNDKEMGLIGYAGRLEKSKNVELLIKTVNDNKRLICEIVGDGSEIVYLKSQVKKLELTNRVKFLGPKEQNELACWYGKLDYIAYLSESESLGLVPLEAIVCGALPILTNIEAFREVQNVLTDVRLCESNVPSVLSLIRGYEALEQEEREKLRIKNSQLILMNYSSRNLKWRLYDIFQHK